MGEGSCSERLSKLDNLEAVLAIRAGKCVECQRFTKTVLCSYDTCNATQGWEAMTDLRLCPACLPDHYTMHELAQDQVNPAFDFYLQDDMRWALTLNAQHCTLNKVEKNAGFVVDEG